MSKLLIDLRAIFKDKMHFLNQHPQSVEFSYLADGKQLSEKHEAKIEKITEYYLNHDIYPVFVPEESITDDNKPVIAESLIDLSLWTNDGLPRFKFKDIRTGRSSNLPCGNGGGRPKKQPR